MKMNLEENGESLFTSKSAVYKNIKMYLWWNSQSTLASNQIFIKSNRYLFLSCQVLLNYLDKGPNYLTYDQREQMKIPVCLLLNISWHQLKILSAGPVFEVKAQ